MVFIDYPGILTCLEGLVLIRVPPLLRVLADSGVLLRARITGRFATYRYALPIDYKFVKYIFRAFHKALHESFLGEFANGYPPR